MVIKADEIESRRKEEDEETVCDGRLAWLPNHRQFSMMKDEVDRKLIIER